MSFAFNKAHVFFLLDKTLHIIGRVKLHNDEHDTMFPNAVVAYAPDIRNRRLVHISAALNPDNSEGTVCVISEGPDAAIFSWGSNSHLQQKPVIRRSRRFRPDDLTQVFSGHPIRRGREHFQGETPVSSACTSSSILVVTQEGGLWYTGKCPIGPNTYNAAPQQHSCYPTLIPPLLFDGTKIIQVAAGFDHLLAVCKKGFVWAWGANDYDQLGAATDDKFISNPMKLDHMLYEGDLMRAVSAGNKHSAGISVEGMCYEWGRKHALQEACLSPPSKSADHTNASELYIESRFKQVCCGSTFTISLDTRGRVWSNGVGFVGEMGLGRLKLSDNCMLVPGFPAGVVISEISCGPNNCGAITTQGDVYTWGRRQIDTQNHVRNGLRSQSASCIFDDAPVCIKKMHRFSRDAEIAFSMGSVHTLNVGPSWLASVPNEIFKCILRPPH